MIEIRGKIDAGKTVDNQHKTYKKESLKAISRVDKSFGQKGVNSPPISPLEFVRLSLHCASVSSELEKAIA